MSFRSCTLVLTKVPQFRQMNIELVPARSQFKFVCARLFTSSLTSSQKSSSVGVGKTYIQVYSNIK